MLKSIDNLRNIFVAGGDVEPIAAAAKGLFLILDKVTEGNLGKVINSVMPCKWNGPSTKCEGKLNTESVGKIAKKVLGLIPLESLPDSLSSVIKIAKDTV